MLNYVRRQLGFHIGRTLFVCVSIASALAVILLLEGFQQGLLAQLKQTVLNRGGDLIVAQAGVINFIAGRSTLPQLSRERIEAVEGVRAAHPLTLVPVIYEQHGRKTPVIFVVYDTAGGPSKISEGIPINAPREIIIGRALAKMHDLSVGDPFIVGGYEFTIAALVDDAAVMFTPLIFITYDDLLDWYFNADIVGDISNLPLLSFLLVDVHPAADLPRLRAAIEAAEPNGDVFTPMQLAENDQILGRNLFGPVMNALIGVGYVICFLVIGIIAFSVSQAQLCSFGVLKALGFTHRTLTSAILLQICILTVLAFPFSLLFAELIAISVEHIAPLYEVQISSPLLLARTAAAAILLAGLGALLPVRLIARLDPTAVFGR